MQPMQPVMRYAASSNTGLYIGIGVVIVIVVIVLFMNYGKSSAITVVNPTPTPNAIPLAKPIQSYKPIGCYADSNDRAIKKYTGDKSIAACANEAKAAGFKVFSIQHSIGSNMKNIGGQCFIDGETTYDKHGESKTCYFDKDGNLYGDSYSNAVYTWNYV